MPWCPHCDEIFPEGPACPRCRAPLMDVSGGLPADEMQATVALPKLKVPRRFKRAFGKLSQPPTPSKQLVAFAVSLVLVAGGFVLGRMSALPSDSPALRIEGRPGLGIGSPGYIDFIGRVRGPSSTDLALMRIPLGTGTIDSLGRFSSPFSPMGHESTRMVAHQESVAVLVTHEARSAVGAFPKDRAPLLWLDGVDAAWESVATLLVLEAGGIVRRWMFDGEGISSELVPGSWLRVLRVHQSPDGAVLEATDPDGLYLAAASAEGIRRTMKIPDDARTLAVALEGRRALVEIAGRMNVWDGVHLTPASLESGFEVYGASFSRDGERVAAVVREPVEGAGKVRLALFSSSGNMLGLRDIATWTRDETCVAVPVWDRSQAWVFVAGNDGLLYAAAVDSPVVKPSPSFDSVGCGITWSL